jgi:hypothetical protein
MFSKNKNGCFDCDRCPKNSDPAQGRHCVMWWETVHTNVQSGEIKTVRSCGFTQLPLYLVEVIKAANRPAAAIESTRNEIARGLAKVASAAHVFSEMAALPQREPEKPLLLTEDN